MAKLRFTKQITTRDGETHTPGDEVSMAADDADRYARAGYGEVVAEPKPRRRSSGGD